MKIIRKDARGGVIEELEVSSITIIKDAIVIKDPVFEKEIVKVKDVEVVKVPYEVLEPVFKKRNIFFDKLNIIKKNFIVKIPILNELEGIVAKLKKKIDEIEKTADKVIAMNDAKIAGGVKEVTLYHFINEDKKIPNLVPVDTPFPKLRDVDTPMPKLRDVDTPIDKIVYNTVIVDKPVFNRKEVETCIINHICPHCRTVSVPYNTEKKDKKGVKEE